MDRTSCCSFSRLFLPNPLVSFNNDSLSTVFQYIMSPPSLRMKNSLSLYMALKIIVTALIMQRSLATVPFFNALYLVLSAFSMFFSLSLIDSITQPIKSTPCYLVLLVPFTCGHPSPILCFFKKQNKRIR